MTVKEEKSLKEIQEIISRAVNKVGGNKENDLCKYLPIKTGGYIHHFTFRKMKQKQPQELGSLIEEFIIKSEKPAPVAPKRRAPRASRKRKENQSFSRSQLDRMLQMARLHGDKEMVSFLSPKRPLTLLKRELIASIRHGRVEQELWNSYVDTISSGAAIEAE